MDIEKLIEPGPFDSVGQRLPDWRCRDAVSQEILGEKLAIHLPLFTKKCLAILFDRTTELFSEFPEVRKVMHIHMNIEVNTRFGTWAGNTLLAGDINDRPT